MRLVKLYPSRLDIRLLTVMLYCWLQTVLTGALLFDTFVLYPNIFGNLPGSLSSAVQFLGHASPGSFLPGLGAFTLVASLTALWLCRDYQPAFACFLTSFFLVATFDFAASILYFWPRNIILFTEGLKVHPAEKLLDVSRQFRAAHWFRMLASIIASFCTMSGLIAIAKNQAEVYKRF